MNSFYLIFSNIRYKALIFFFIIFAGVLEFVGLSLIYPLISLIFNLEVPDNKLIDILNDLLNVLNFNSKYLIIASICILIITKAIFLLIYRYFSTINVISFQVKLQRELFSNFFLTKYLFSANKKSKLINSISEQAKLAQSAMQILFNIFENITILIFLIFLCYFVSIEILLLSFLLATLLILIFKFTISLSNIFSLNLINANELFYKLINKSLNSYKYIKVTNTDKNFFKEYIPIISDIKVNTLKFVLLNRGSKIMIEPIILIVISIIFFVSLNFFNTQVTTIVVMYFIIARLFQKLLALINLLQQYAKDSESVKYCYKLLNQINENKEISGKNNFIEFQNLKLKKIHFSYGSNTILKDLSLTIHKNKITTIYGKSGIGKTTLSNLILGLIKPTNGEIILNNKNLNNYDLNKFRSKIGYVSQDNSIFNMTLKENLTLRNRSAKEKEIINYLNIFDLKEFIHNKSKVKNIIIDQNTANLSNGQKQRICLIRELISNPQILILDEITSSVDKTNLNKVLNILYSLKKHTTIFLITHQSEYKKISDFNYKLINKKLIQI